MPTVCRPELISRVQTNKTTNVSTNTVYHLMEEIAIKISPG